MSPLRAGAAGRVVTPPAQGTLLIGPLQRSTGVHDDLYARALVLDDGQQRVALVTMDLVGLDFAMVDRLRAEVGKQTGMPGSHVMLNCSHTHSAPFTIPWSVLGWETFDREAAGWRDELVSNVVEAVRSAVSCLATATLCYARQPVQIGFNRRLPTDEGIRMRPNPDGPVVPWTDVLRVDGADGEPVAVLLSHAAHPVIVHGASTLISADYPGYAVDAVRKRLGDQVIAMFAQGCGANINADPLRGGFDAAQRAGTVLGTAAVEACAHAERIDTDPLRVHSAVLDLPFQPVPPADQIQTVLTQAQQRLADLQHGNAPPSAVWFEQDTVRACEELLAIGRRGERPTLRFEIQGFALGRGLCLVGLSHEVFAEYQWAADDMSPFAHTMVLGYTNGCESYIPCRQDFESGGYEAGAAPRPAAPLRYRHRLTLQPDVESQIVAAMGELFGQLADRAH